MLFNRENVRIFVVDDDSITDSYNNKSEKDCFIEIKITKNFLRQFFGNTKGNSLNSDFSIYNMTKREKQVLKCIVECKNNSQIAQYLKVSIHTAKAHVRSVYSKLNVQNRNEAIVKAIKDYLVDL